ncbi:histidine kinase [Lacinutrix sp. C3R15]|uniref:sensor histidine kinase n=1 Tax=Flavobacteriaceae TaxID=49546 RepID=UPI001C084FD4|nr:MULTISPECIES: histidine kinase [Flavobacteriaceae]MBU2939284.1 histidine kinase [Lacinutrix sp. C3R15]MDO6622599.1 histidine kinase [Oceanihabitans sp. 1_MG-2023]
MQLLFAQQPVSIHLTEKDGVPDNEFYDIIEDNDGYIWLAADKGLFRFDGVNYKKFQHPEQRGLSVFSLNKDENGTIWFVNISGQIFYIENEEVVLFGDYKEAFKGELPNLKVSNNCVILFMPSKLFVLSVKSKKEIFNTSFKVNYGLIEPNVFNNAMFYSTQDNVIKRDLKSLEIEEKVPITAVFSRYIQRSFISEINQNTLVFFTRSVKEGLNFYKIPKDFKSKIEPLNHDFPNIKIINVKTINNQTWYCTENGVFICEVIENTLIVKKHLFPNQFITNVIVDKHTNYWFTTLNNALFVVPNLAVNNVAVDVKNDKIKTVNLGKPNELLITTIGNKLHKYNVNSKTQQSYTFTSKLDVHFVDYNPYTKKYYSNTNLNTFVFNSNLEKEKDFEGGGTLKDIYHISLDTTLVAFRSAVKSVNSFSKNQKDLYKKSTRGYAVHYNTKNKHSYFATIDGLFFLDKAYHEQEIKYKGKTIYINKMEETQDGILWCSSFKNGLFAIKNNNVIKHFTVENGLLSNSNSYLKAKENNLWIAGENGVQNFNTKTGSFQNLTKREGINSYNYNGLEIIKDNVFIGSPEQIIYFNEKDVFKPYNTPEVNITSLNIANIKQPLKSEYSIQEKASAVDIHFNAIGYKSSTSGKFEYRLIGLQNNWTESIAGISNVQYNTLLEGDYTFQIRNVTDNKEEAVTKEIQFKVTKPFWEKIWFYALLSLLFITIIVLFYRQKMKANDAEKNKLLKQLEINNELINLRLENLRSQMNPHFVFNALNSIQDYILSNKKDLAGDYLGKFADLIRTYLEHSTKGKLTLEEEIGTLNMYLELEKLRFEDSLQYTIEKTKDINPELISIPTMLIQPYVENALKHGLLHKKNDRKLSVSFSQFSEGIIQCIIEDNGVGREKSKQLNRMRSQQHKSFALKATNERLGLLNYGKSKKVGVQIIDLISATKQPIGTKVILKIPIS